MPRRRASRSLSMDLELHKPSKSQTRPSSSHSFTARFFGEANMDRLESNTAQSGSRGGRGDGRGDGDGDGDGDVVVDVDVEMSGNGHPDADAAAVRGGSNGTPTRARPSKRKRNDMEDGPINLTELRLRQLKEDRDSYGYDLQWCQDVLDGEDLTPAEMRTFQMRQLDLGHQLRMANHQIEEIEAEMQNQRFFGGAVSAYTTRTSYSNFNSLASFMNAEPPQERRGPGRPPGSKNRPRDAAATPKEPSSNAQKAAALASAGAKRTLPSEIRVATSNGRAPASGAAASGAAAKPNKRPRVEVGSPIGSSTEDDDDDDVNETTNKPLAVDNTRRLPGSDDEVIEVVKPSNARRTGRTRDTTKADDRFQNGTAHTVVNKKGINASSAGATPASPASLTPAHAHAHHALPNRTPASNRKTGPPAVNDTTAVNNPSHKSGRPVPTYVFAELDPTGPGGSMYQRLGHHQCQLCTSQKYLMQTTPKQPSEPSSWPLRDISKMVTHYTRMHGEHNKMERCMELGRALEDNRGPFRYWLQETKRVKVSLAQVNEAIIELQEGRLPELLRRLSNAARAFPKD